MKNIMIFRYTDSALKAACELSFKYLNDRFLPDKAIDVIDEAGAFVRLSGHSHRVKINPVDIEKIVAKMARVPDRERLHTGQSESWKPWTTG